MLDFLENIVRKQKLKKNASPVKTGFRPITEVRSVAVILDVEDPSYDRCKDQVLIYFRNSGVKRVDIYYCDFRKVGKQELLLTSIQNTILKKNLTWYGAPRKSDFSALFEDEGSNYDMLVNLVDKEDYTVEFIAKCSTAKFKIGIRQFDSRPFDFVYSFDGKVSCLDAFLKIKSFIPNFK